MERICKRWKCDPIALIAAVAYADAGGPGTLAEVAEQWDLPVGALSAGLTARRRWRVRRGEPAVVLS